MSLFMKARVELSLDILNYFLNSDLDERCRSLEYSLKQVCDSVSVEIREQGKLELCGQWNDIIKAQEMLSKWMKWQESGKQLMCLSEFIREELSLKASDTTVSHQTAPPEIIKCETLVATSQEENTEVCQSAAKNKLNKTTDNHHLETYSRPKRNVKHRILPLLKCKRKHFDVSVSSGSEDGDSEDVGQVDIKHEAGGIKTNERLKLSANLTTDRKESPRSSGRPRYVLNNKEPLPDQTRLSENVQHLIKDSIEDLTCNSLTSDDVVTNGQHKESTTENDALRSRIRIRDDKMNDLIERDGEYYVCSKCPYKTLACTNIKLHVVRVHLPKAFHCDRCSKCYALHKDLLSHMTVHTKPHPCQYCSVSFAKPYMLRQHIRCRHEGIPKKRGRKPNGKSKNTSSAVLLSCKHCDYVTFNNWNLMAHLQRVHAEKVYKCGQCESAFGLMKDLSQHKKLLHATQFECSHCKKVLKNAYSLKMHVKVIHEGVKLTPAKSYQCHLCGKVCRNKTDYTVHMNKQHLNIKPFKCDQCGMEFFAKGNLTAHQAIHSDEAKFVCAECGKKFKQRQGLQVHRYIHKSIEDRPFKCASCGKVFTQHGALMRHQRVHSGIRPYLCKFDPKNCKAAFNDYSILRRHLQGIHKIKNVQELRSAVQRACDESRQIIANQLKTSPGSSHKSSSAEGKKIMFEQKLQARRLKNSRQQKEQGENIVVKLEDKEIPRPGDAELTHLQKVMNKQEEQLGSSIPLDLVTETRQLQDYVEQFNPQISVSSCPDAKIQFHSALETSDLERQLIRVVYLTEDSTTKSKQTIIIPAGNINERIPESLEEAVKEALDERPINEELTGISQSVLQRPLDLSDTSIQGSLEADSIKASSVLDAENPEIRSVLTRAVVSEDSDSAPITLQPVVSLQSLLQTEVTSSTTTPCQLLNLQNYSEETSLERSEREPSVNSTEIVLEQVTNPSSQVKMAILTDVGQHAMQNIESHTETEQIIVITSMPEGQQPDLGTILSMYQQGSLSIAEDLSCSVEEGPLSTTNNMYARSVLSYNESNGILETLITPSEHQSD